MNIEGIPEGWELVRVGKPKTGEFFIDGLSCPHQAMDDEHFHGCAIIRKIEKPKQYRAFANAAEYEPHRDRWVEYTSPNCDYSMYQISAYSSQRVWLGPNATGIEYREAFHCLKFDDGTPFGVEVAS